MRISRYSFCFFILITALSAQAEVKSLAELKSHFSDKRTEEAILILKDQHKKLLKTEKNHQELARWQSVFQMEDTMVAHERALGLRFTRPEVADAEFRKALILEPHNRGILIDYLAFLIQSDQYKKAANFAEERVKLQPYMGIFKIYEAHAKAMLSQSEAVSCEVVGLEPIEKKYCYFVLILQKTHIIPPAPESEARALLKKTDIPDAHLWLGKAYQSEEELKKYISHCQSLSTKEKKTYRIVPGMCSDIEEANQLIKAGTTWFPYKKELFSSY